MQFRFSMRIFLLYSALAIVVLGGALAVFYNYTFRIVSARQVDNLQEVVQRAQQQLESTIMELDKIALYCSTNPVISRFFSGPVPYEQLDTETKVELDRTLLAISLPSSLPAIRTSLYNAEGKYLSSGLPDSATSVKARIASPEELRKILSGLDVSGRRIISLPHPDFWGRAGAPSMISVFRPILDWNYIAPIAIAEVQIPLQTLTDLVSGESTSGLYKFIYTGDGELVVRENAEGRDHIATEVMRLIGESPDRRGVLYFQPDKRPKQILFFSKFQYSDWTLVMGESVQALRRPVNKVSTLFLLSIITVIVALSISFFYIAKRVTRPLDTLVRTINSAVPPDASGGEPSQDRKSVDEFESISSTFDSIFQKLQRSMDENRTAKSEELKAHFIALQSQIDPHFLYNILSIISAESRLRKADGITEMCRELTSMLRYISVFNERTVTLADELGHVRSYLNLMQIRFEDQLQYSILQAPGMRLDRIKVPRLILQPIVENCFRHAFKRISPPWKLELSFSSDGDRWRASVGDNGGGIDEKQQYAIFFAISEFMIDPAQHIEAVRFGGMGLVNCVVRLKMSGSNQSVFEIGKSHLGGAEITIGDALHGTDADS